MELAIEVELLNRVGAVGFEAAVEVVDFDAGGGGGRPVEDFGGECLAEWVLAQLLPAGDAVVALVQFCEEVGISAGSSCRSASIVITISL